MKKNVLILIKNLKKSDKKRLEKQLKKPCFDWDFTLCRQVTIWFSPLFFEKKETLLEFLEENANAKEEQILLSNDSQCFCIAKEYQIASMGYQDKRKDEFLEGTDFVVEALEDVEAELLYRQMQRANHIPWTILTTERLVVRELQLSDLDALFELYEGEGMTDYIEPLYPYEKEKEYQQAYITHMYRYYGYGMWLVFEKTSGKLVGRAGIEHREEFNGELELGYAIGRPFWRKGYATEVCRAICEYSKKHLNAGEIFCMVESENKASIALAEKIGFVFERECRKEGKKMCVMRCIL